MVIIININEGHEELHYLIKGKQMNKEGEKTKNRCQISPKIQTMTLNDPKKIIKGKFDCFLDKPLPSLKSE